MPDVVVVGAGPMGALHAQTVAACPETRLVAVVDRHPERSGALAERFGCGTALTDADLFIVATPAETHLEVAAPLLDRGWVLVEKPLSPSWAPLWEHPRALGAWSERFHRYWVGRRIRRDFRSIRRRISRSRGVHPVLDLMVHDLDLLLWRCTGVALEEVRQHDGVEALLRFDGGAALLRIEPRDGQHELEVDGQRLHRATTGPDPLTRQLRCVLDHVRTGRGPLQASRARAVLELAANVVDACDSD